MFDNFEQFKKVYQKLTENYGAMVINNKVRSSKIEDCVFYYKVNINQSNFDNFKICDHVFWDIKSSDIKQKKKVDDNTIEIDI